MARFLTVGLLLHMYFRLSPATTLTENSALDDRRVWSVCLENNGSSIDTNETCICGEKLDYAVDCSNHSDIIKIEPCYCMYYEASNNRTIAGNCFVTCFNVGHNYFRAITRYSVKNYSSFNEEICSSVLNVVDTNREGRFCGRCKQGFGLAAYSYHYVTCIPCKDYGFKNWMRYFTVALLPLTIFYFVVVLLKINVSSSRLTGSVFALQCMMSPVQLCIYDGIMYGVKRGHMDGNFKMLNFFLGVFGIVNLDFFRTTYPYFCLHPKLNFIHIASLDFIVALYPFFLIFLTYLLVSMYDRHFRVVVWAWKPFKWCLRHYQRQFNVKGSLIETFATFILLSNLKILGVCFDLLVPTRAWTETGTALNNHFLYPDATIEYFSPEHLPFAVLALIIGFFFVLVPFLILLLYPCSCFQKALNTFGCQCQTLRIFMDAFQGSYKTNPRDLRCFSTFYLLLRFLVLFTIAEIRSVFFIPSISLLLIAGGVIFAVFQPYKQSQHNKFDVVMIFMMVLFYTGFTSTHIASALDRHWQTLSQFMMIISMVIVLVVTVIPIVFYSVFFQRLKNVFIKGYSALCMKREGCRRESAASLLTSTLDEENRRLLPPAQVS